MKLAPAAAKKCIKLLDAIDMYVLENCNVIKKKSKYSHGITHEIRLRLRKHWQRHPAVVDDFISRGTDLSIEDKAIINCWKNRDRQQYVMVKHYKDYSAFLTVEDNKYYGVIALTDDFNELLPYELPLVVETWLLPYKGQIVWDGLVRVASIFIGENMAVDMTESCDKKRKQGKIITRF